MNHPMVRLAVLLVVAAAVGGFAYRAWTLQASELKHQLDLERIRREFLERDALARAMSEPQRYKDEIRAVLKSYFAELTEHFNRFPAFRNYERFQAEMADKRKGKKLKEQELAQYEDRYRATKGLWDVARSGKYDPVFTAGEKGLRFDLLDVQPVPDPKEPRLRFTFALWGAQRKWIEEAAAGVRVRRLSVSANFQDLVFRGLDATEKPITEMRVSGDPFRVESPERFIEEFPPGAVVGYYDVPKIPNEVVTAELSFGVATRSVVTGEEAAARFVWKLPAPPEWKLPPGTRWEGAQVREEEPEAGAVGRSTKPAAAARP
jgi:hypothetical protein